MEISLARPIRLGRADPIQHIFPEIDLTGFRGMEHGVSREHACIVRRGDGVEIQDLASTNGTLLNGRRLAPYTAATLKDGDRLQLGRLLIEVGITSGGRRRTNDE
jgi:pSer/pThr/pTyr-binding forkhead associated (FHA) protein